MDERAKNDAVLLLGAGLGATLMVARSALGVTRLMLAVPAAAVQNAVRVPQVRRGLSGLERVWADGRTGWVRTSTAELDRLVPRLAAEIVKRLDLNSVIRESVDFNEVIEQIEMERVIERVDLIGIARKLIEELDIPEIIRDSSGTMAQETLDGLRVQSLKADQWVAHVVDRLLGRSDRSKAPPGSTPPLSSTGPDPAGA